MKKLLRIIALTLSCWFCCVQLHSQTPLPGIGAVYNFNAGDSFLYKLTDVITNTPIMYVNRTVLSRDASHYPDSLIYNIEEVFLDTNALNPAVWDTVRKVYYQCNDTIFPKNGFMSCQEATDSCGAINAITVTTDTLFPGLTVYHADFGCGWWNSGWNNAALGLGIIHAVTDCGDFVADITEIVMVHYYKAATGVSEIEPGIAFRLSPNPAAASVTVIADESVLGNSLTVSDITGRIITDFRLTTVSTDITTLGLAKGIYFVTISNGRQSFTQKLVVQR